MRRAGLPTLNWGKSPSVTNSRNLSWRKRLILMKALILLTEMVGIAFVLRNVQICILGKNKYKIEEE